MMRLLAFFAVTLATFPIAAQPTLFPTFSVTATSDRARFDTEVRLDPENTAGTFGSRVGFESDLAMPRSKHLARFGLTWQPAARHEIAASYFSAPRSGVATIQREIV